MYNILYCMAILHLFFAQSLPSFGDLGVYIIVSLSILTFYQYYTMTLQRPKIIANLNAGPLLQKSGVLPMSHLPQVDQQRL